VEVDDAVARDYIALEALARGICRKDGEERISF
jgi:hypothetical protein